MDIGFLHYQYYYRIHMDLCMRAYIKINKFNWMCSEEQSGVASRPGFRGPV